MKNNVWYLTKQRFSTILFHTGRIITYAIFLIAFLVIDLINLLFLDGSIAQVLSNILEICNGVVIGLLMISLTLSILRGEVTSNQVNLELREGYKPRQIYIARLIEIFFDYAVFVIIAIVVNMIVVGATSNMDSIQWYHAFVTPLGWYAIIGIVGIGMAGFFATMMNSGGAGSIASIVIIILVVVGGFVGGIVQLVSSDKNSRDDAGTMMTQLIDSRAQRFDTDDFKISSAEQWKEEVENKFLHITSAPNSNGDVNNNGMNSNNNNGNYKDIVDTDLYENKTFDWDTYYRMISGDWTVNSGYYNPWDNEGSLYSNNANIFASFAAFGPGILKEAGLPDEIKEFYKASDEFFKNNLVNKYQFKDLENWDILDGKDTINYNSTYSNGDGVEHHPYNLRTGSTYSKEDFKSILDAMAGSKLAKNYSLVNDLKTFADSKALSSMFNTNYQDSNSGNNDSGYNLDNNTNLYPLFAVGDYKADLTSKNMQSKFIDLCKSLKVTPAEFIFNKNMMYYATMALDDMEEFINHYPGQTWISQAQWTYDYSSGNYNQQDGIVELDIANSDKTRINGEPIAKTDLKKGKLSEDIINSLKLVFQTGYFDDKKDQMVKKDINITTDDLRKAQIEDKGFGEGLSIRIPKHIDLQNFNSPNLVSAESRTNKIWFMNDLAGYWNTGNDKITIKNDTSFYANEYLTGVTQGKDNIGLQFLNALKDTDVLSGLIIKNDGKVVDIKDAHLNGKYAIKLNVKNPGNVTIQTKDEKFINTDLVDGTFYKNSFYYAESKTHSTAMNLIYNPLIQMSSMFNGVNYRAVEFDNLYTSYMNQNIVGINNLIVEKTFSDNVVNVKRVVYPEIVYIEYAVIEALFIFAGYWIYRKKIVS